MLNYDPLVLNYNSSDNTGGFPDMIIHNPIPGTITVSGTYANLAGFSLADSSVFFTLNFTYLGGTALLSWFDDGESCEYASQSPDFFVLNDMPAVNYYVNGSVGPDKVTAVPTIAVGTITNPSTCGGNGTIPITCTNVPDGIYTIIYDEGSFQNIAVLANAALIVASAGTYNNLQLTVNGETSVLGVNVVLTDPASPDQPVINASGPTSICEGGSVVLTSDEALTYEWSTGETTQSITVSVSGNYSVTVSNASGCSATSEGLVVAVNAKPEKPVKVNCWDEFVFNTNNCEWENSGVQPEKPAMVNCWDEFVFNTNNCKWENSGVQPEKPAMVNCWDEFVFNTNNCKWENSVVQTEKPAMVNCWDEFVFNTNSCGWENSGVQPEKPAMVNCWDEFVFNTNSCEWENSGVQPEKPAKINCWDEFVFNTNSCEWENNGVQTEKPATVNCWDEFRFNETLCAWENQGTKPVEPTPLKSWDEFIFNPVSCAWENMGVATGVEIHGQAVDMNLTCYPNPFSEKATIKYLLPEDGRVNVEVTGILGNRIRLLSNQQQAAGEYLLDFNGRNLASGIYQITLRLTDHHGGDLIKTIRMIKQ